jgi:hypothetical protein
MHLYRWSFFVPQLQSKIAKLLENTTMARTTFVDLGGRKKGLPRFQRGFHMAHDVAREKKMELWRRFEAEGRLGGDFRVYLKQNYKPTTAEN